MRRREAVPGVFTLCVAYAPCSVDIHELRGLLTDAWVYRQMRG